jgi:hypothetical protein
VNAKWDSIYLPSSLTTGNSQRECRERAAEVKAEQDAKRGLAIEEQSSARHSAGDRIRLWEALHGVRMPRQKRHAILAVIAADTRLTIEQVTDEQQHRYQAVEPAKV